MPASPLLLRRPVAATLVKIALLGAILVTLLEWRPECEGSSVRYSLREESVGSWSSTILDDDDKSIALAHGNSNSESHNSETVLHLFAYDEATDLFLHDHPRELLHDRYESRWLIDSARFAKVWVELTRSGSHHEVAYLGAFQAKQSWSCKPRLNSDSDWQQCTRDSLSMELCPDHAKFLKGNVDIQILPANTTIRPAGEPSVIRALVTRDGRRIVKYGLYAGVQVHVWVTRPGEFYFRHGHGELLDDGSLRVTMRFPKAGEYRLWVQPAIAMDAITFLPVLTLDVDVP